MDIETHMDRELEKCRRKYLPIRTYEEIVGFQALKFFEEVIISAELLRLKTRNTISQGSSLRRWLDHTMPPASGCIRLCHNSDYLYVW